MDNDSHFPTCSQDYPAMSAHIFYALDLITQENNLDLTKIQSEDEYITRLLNTYFSYKNHPDSSEIHRYFEKVSENRKKEFDSEKCVVPSDLRDFSFHTKYHNLDISQLLDEIKKNR